LRGSVCGSALYLVGGLSVLKEDTGATGGAWLRGRCRTSLGAWGTTSRASCAAPPTSEGVSPWVITVRVGFRSDVGVICDIMVVPVVPLPWDILSRIHSCLLQLRRVPSDANSQCVNINDLKVLSSRQDRRPLDEPFDATPRVLGIPWNGGERDFFFLR